MRAGEGVREKQRWGERAKERVYWCYHSQCDAFFKAYNRFCTDVYFQQQKWDAAEDCQVLKLTVYRGGLGREGCIDTARLPAKLNHQETSQSSGNVWLTDDKHMMCLSK